MMSTSSVGWDCDCGCFVPNGWEHECRGSWDAPHFWAPEDVLEATDIPAWAVCKLGPTQRARYDALLDATCAAGLSFTPSRRSRLSALVTSP
jgi:hypothetical protein